MKVALFFYFFLTLFFQNIVLAQSKNLNQWVVDHHCQLNQSSASLSIQLSQKLVQLGFDNLEEYFNSTQKNQTWNYGKKSKRIKNSDLINLIEQDLTNNKSSIFKSEDLDLFKNIFSSDITNTFSNCISHQNDPDFKPSQNELKSGASKSLCDRSKNIDDLKKIQWATQQQIEQQDYKIHQNGCGLSYSFGNQIDRDILNRLMKVSNNPEDPLYPVFKDCQGIVYTVSRFNYFICRPHNLKNKALKDQFKADQLFQKFERSKEISNQKFLAQARDDYKMFRPYCPLSQFEKIDWMNSYGAPQYHLDPCLKADFLNSKNKILLKHYLTNLKIQKRSCQDIKN